MSEAAFAWGAFLRLAVELVQRPGDAGAQRSAISRAYYAAFHEASAHAVRQGVGLTFTGRDHALVWDWFVRDGADPRLYWIGEAGRLLRRARRHADYDPAPIQDLSSEAQTAVRLTERITSELRRMG